MKESKRKIIRDVAARLDALPEDKRQYVLGIMDGIMISSGNTRRDNNVTTEKVAQDSSSANELVSENVK